MGAPRWLAYLVSVVATTGCGRYWVCDLPDPDRTSELPQRLAETGLYADIATGELAADVVAYTPQFPLWSDGADKRRWIWLPPGTQIDTDDQDEWKFPDGTKLWKEFSVAGIAIETRLIEKRGPADDDWIPISYVWNATRAMRSPPRSARSTRAGPGTTCLPRANASRDTAAGAASCSASRRSSSRRRRVAASSISPGSSHRVA